MGLVDKIEMKYAIRAKSKDGMPVKLEGSKSLFFRDNRSLILILI